jgi:hypothetical protein
MLHLLYGTNKFAPQPFFFLPVCYLLNFRRSLSFKTCCYGINLFQVVIITTILLATFYVDVYLFVIATFALFLINACTIVLYGHSQDQ